MSDDVVVVVDAPKKRRTAPLKTVEMKVDELFNRGILRPTTKDMYLRRNVHEANLPGNRPPRHIKALDVPGTGLKINVFQDQTGHLFVFAEFQPWTKIYPGQTAADVRNRGIQSSCDWYDYFC